MDTNSKEEKALKDRYSRDTAWIYILLIATVVLTIIAFTRQAEPEWKKYQSDFKRLIGEKFGKEAEAKFSPEIRQIWIKPLNRLDRCTTCHLGVDIEKLNGKEVPVVFRAHPQKDLMTKHPYQEFGCTFCHGGKGYALTREEAHFSDQKGWVDVFLSEDLAKKYGYSDYQKMPLMEINCNACHIDEKEVPGLVHINKAKKIFEEKMCTCCHNFHGKGGLVGPDLTYEGDKPADLYDFTSITDWKGHFPSVFSWHFLHFKHPYFVTLTTLMPNLNLTDEDIRSLIMLVLSYKRVPEHLKVKVRSQAQDSMISGERG